MNIGDLISILDNIDCETITRGTIKMIEPDDSIEGLLWIYVRANDEAYNNQYDPRIGSFWTMINNRSEYIVEIKPATL